MLRPVFLACVAGAALSLGACTTPPPPQLGEWNGTLRPCPAGAACVHTGLRHPDGVRGMYVFSSTTEETLSALRQALESLPGVSLVDDSGLYLRAEARGRLPGRVDDVEILLTYEREIVVRSAARGSITDFGANRKRVEALRQLLVDSGLIRG